MPDPQAQPKHKLRVPRARRGPFRILLGTRKGAFVMDGEGAGRDFEAPRPVILGRTCFHLVRDPFRRDVLLAGVRGPGEGPTVVRSEDAGLTWAEADAAHRACSGHSEADRNKAAKALRAVARRARRRVVDAREQSRAASFPRRASSSDALGARRGATVVERWLFPRRAPRSDCRRTVADAAARAGQ